MEKDEVCEDRNSVPFRHKHCVTVPATTRIVL